MKLACLGQSFRSGSFSAGLFGTSLLMQIASVRIYPRLCTPPHVNLASAKADKHTAKACEQ